MKFLGTGAAQVQALKGVELIAHCRRIDVADGAVRQRQDHAAVHTRMHADAEPRNRARSGPIHRRCRARGACQAQARACRLRFPVLSSVSDADRDGQRQARARCPRRASAGAIAKAHDALATVGLSHKTNSYPRELSGGEQQRVAIARAIVGRPSAILADEPTAALDSENGHAIMTVLARIARDPSRGVLVVTHDPRILPFANRIVRIEDGRIAGEEPGGAGLRLAASRL